MDFGRLVGLFGGGPACGGGGTKRLLIEIPNSGGLYIIAISTGIGCIFYPPWSIYQEYKGDLLFYLSLLRLVNNFP